MKEIKEEPPHAQTKCVGMDKLPEQYRSVSVGAVFWNTVGPREKTQSSPMLFGIHHSGCHRPSYLLVGDGDT